MVAEANRRYIIPNVLNLLARQSFHLARLPFFPFPAEIGIVDNGQKRAEELLQQGYAAIVPITHFSQRDAAEMIVRPALYCSGIFDIPIITPMEYVQSVLHPIYVKIAKMCGISVFPVVNDDTLEKIAQKKIPAEYSDGRAIQKGDGMRAYLTASWETLQNGGMVGIALQSGRRGKLELPQQLPGSKLEGPIDALLRRADLEKVFFLFLSLSLKGEHAVVIPNERRRGFLRADMSDVDYEKKRGLLLAEKFDIRVGPTLTYREMEKLAKLQGLTVDQLSFVVHAMQVDPKYNCISPDLCFALLNNYLDMFPD